MKTKITPILFGLLLGLLALSSIGWSQGPIAAITGLITDSSGAAVPNATITVKDVDRGTNWPTHANDAGYYNLPRLPIGTYDVTVEANGFQAQVQRAIHLEIDQTAKVDFQLKVGQVATTLEVTSAAPLLQTETTQVSSVM